MRRRFIPVAGGNLAGWSHCLRSGGGRGDGGGGPNNNIGGGQRGFFARLRRNMRADGGGRGDEELTEGGGATEDGDRSEKDGTDPIVVHPWILPLLCIAPVPRTNAWLALACSSFALSTCAIHTQLLRGNGRIHYEWRNVQCWP